MKQQSIALFCPGLGFIMRGFETLTREIFLMLREEKDLSVELYQGTGILTDKATALPSMKRTHPLWSSSLLKHFRYTRYLSYQLECFIFALQLLWHLRRSQPGIIYFSDTPPASFLKAFRFLLPKAKFLYCNGAPSSPEVCGRYDAVQVMNHQQERELKESNYPSDRIFLVPQGITTTDYMGVSKPDAKAQWQLPTDKHVLLSVGALTARHKRMDWIIQECSQLSTENVILWLIGAREDETEEIERLATELLPQQNIRFDTLSYEDIPSAYAAADSFALASLNEGFGRVYLEAMAAGLPVFAHKTTHTSWLLGEENYGLIDMTEAGSLSKKLQEIMKDQKLRETTGKENNQRVRDTFDWEVLKPQYLSMLENVSELPKR